MLQRAAVAEVKAKEISKADGYLVIAMRLYPRFLPKDLTNEYLKSLSPGAELFESYQRYKKAFGVQNRAFELAGYERRFTLESEGMNELARLSGLSRDRNVYLICQCTRKEHCHVDLMLLMAEHHFHARIGKLPYDYPEFTEKLRNGLDA